MNVTVRGKSRPYRTVSFDAERNAVLLIEQRLLPHKFEIIATRNFSETAAAIHDMIVRGAGAIGATAAYGLAQGARAFRGNPEAGKPPAGDRIACGRAGTTCVAKRVPAHRTPGLCPDDATAPAGSH